MNRGMVKTAALPLQMAIFERLENDAILSDMILGVYDEVKEGTKLPYVEIGDDTTNPNDTKTNYGENTTVTLHVWGRGPGKVETKRIMNAVLQAISSAPLVVPGFEVESIEREFLETFSDGPAYHGVCRFRIYIKQ